ncbi:MAG TPA: translocation/assembly module TamB domain-containing protein [Polyangiaceae bacterium]|jgi:translocation and assembly module TamB|nr:translocation/assembly module TamB domain-containing protein [Polyangiaceae bacterium]
MARPRRWPRLVGKGVAWFVGVVAGLVVLVLLCANLPFARRIIAKQVTGALDGVVSGKITIDHIGRVGLTGVSGVQGRLSDAAGHALLTANGVSASLRTITLVKSLFGKSGLDVHVDSIVIDHVDARLDADKDGNLLLLAALSPPPPPPNAPPPKPSTLKLTIDEAKLGSAWAHGVPSPGFLVDADLRKLNLGVTLAGGKTTADLRALRVETRAMPNGANVKGDLVAHVELPPAPLKVGANGSFTGTVGDIRAQAKGSLANDVVSGHLGADAEPASLSSLVPSLRLRSPAKLIVDAGGTLPNVHATGAVETGPAKVALTADAVVGSPMHGHLELDADHVNLAAILQNAPESDLNATVRANGSLKKNGKLTGNFEVDARPAEIASQALPAMTLKGNLSESNGDVKLDVNEPGTKTHLTADLNLQKMELDYDASISVPDFTHLKRLPAGSSGSASIRARGMVYLTTSTFSADVRAEVANVQSSGARIRKADIAALVTGPFSNPDVDATVTGSGVVAAGRTFDSVSLLARGNQSGAHVTASLKGAPGTPDVDATTNVLLGDGVSLDDVLAKIGKGQERVRARVATVRMKDGVIQANGITVDGAGADVSAAARIAPAGMDVRAISAGFDIGKVARALGVEDRSIKGKLSLDVDLKTRGNTARGKVGVELTGGGYRGVSGVELRMATSVDGRRFTGKINAKVDGGHVDIDADDLTLGGSPLSARAWTHAFGHLALDANVDLSRLARVLPTEMLPFDDMAGHVAVTGELTRGATDASPETTWTVHTDGFRASAKSEGQPPHDGTKVRAPPSWHTAGVDVDGSLAIAKEHGRTTFGAQFRDANGALASVDLSADLPYLEVLSDPSASAKTLETVPFKLRFAIPQRRLSKLPPMLATSGMDGDVALTLEASETAREPRVQLTATLDHLEARGRRKAMPVDVRIDGKYSDGVADIGIAVDAKAKNALVLKSKVNAKVADFIDGKGDKAEWDGTVNGKFDGFPLDVLSLIGSRRVKGKLSGDLDAATGTHTKPHATVNLNVDGLGVGRASGPAARATVTAAVTDTTATAKVRFDQQDGFAEATASAGMNWSGPLAIHVDPSRGVAKAEAKASHFRLQVLQPFVQGILADLDGRLDADAHFEAASIHGAPKLDGQVVLDQGSFELTSAGQEFHDVHAKVVLNQNGTLRVDDVRAQGLTGSMKATGEATLDGLDLKRATLSASVPTTDPFPVTVQGQSLAKASGNFKVEAVPVPAKKEIDVTVTVPNAKVEMFDKPTHDLQELDHDEHVRIGYHRTPDEFVVVPLERPTAPVVDEIPTTIVATVKLGDIEIERGTDLRVALDGTPKITAGATTQIEGEIHLKSGFIYVQGKKFEIENGTISFIGAPDNPNVVVTAGWTAPEGSRVYADFVGPLKTGKVTLRSEPAHNKSEILSLILFGTTDGQGQSSGSSPGTTAAGLAGGVATQGLNKALDDVTGLEITTRIDTSDSSNPRPELEVRVARDVTVAVSHVLGVPPPGTNPDLNYATIDWRFLRNWSVDTTVGDEGSTLLDLIWQYRY